MRFFLLLIFLLTLPVSQAAAQVQSNYTLNDDLLYRINFGSSDDIKVLLAKGANPNAKTRQGETALNVAMERNDNESERMAEALIDAGADIEKPDKDGNPPIITAIKYKLNGVVKQMIAKGITIHTTAPDGTPLIDYAKQHGTPEMIAEIQALLDKERAYAESLRTPERYHEVVRQYATQSCFYQYWSYVMASRQNPDKDAEDKKKIEDIKAQLLTMISQIQPYYTASSTDDMVKVANEVVKQIYNQLDDMVSNTNRMEHGVGKDDDAKARCDHIVEAMPIQTLPVSINPITAAEAQNDSASASGAKQGVSVLLPMDPSSSANHPGVSPMPIPR